MTTTPPPLQTPFTRRLLFPAEFLAWLALWLYGLSIFRELADLYAGMGMKLPGLTILFIDLANFFSRFWWAVLWPAGLAGLGLLAVWLSGLIKPWLITGLEFALRLFMMIWLLALFIAAKLPLVSHPMTIH